MPFDISKAREHFPALQQDQVFLDNAGGSQTLITVIDSWGSQIVVRRWVRWHWMISITEYLSKTNVQLGASYHTGTQSNTKYEEGYQAAAKYINAGRDEIGIFCSGGF
jgi:selenocysteine lyase/cysteine desulfurase